MKIIQATYYAHGLTLQLQNKNRSSRWCHPCVIRTRSRGEKKENAEVKFYPQKSHVAYIRHNPHACVGILYLNVGCIEKRVCAKSTYCAFICDVGGWRSLKPTTNTLPFTCKHTSLIMRRCLKPPTI